MKKTYQRIEFLNEKIYELSKTFYKRPEVFMLEDAPDIIGLPSVTDHRWQKFDEEKLWGRIPDTHCWFRVHYAPIQFGKGLTALGVSTGTTDDDWNVLNPQFIAYIDGKAIQALDANHREIFLNGRENKDILLHAYNGLNFSSDIHMWIGLYEYDKPSLDLYYTVFILLKILELTEIKSKLFSVILNNLKCVLGNIDFTQAKSEVYYTQIQQANDRLQNELLPLLKDDFNPTAYAVGSSHLDVAWKWTTEQTKEKAQRTAATALEYMRMFPQYKFFASQALLYKYLKVDAPAIYSEIKERVKEGRWNVGGGMYVEPDCNIPSGESFIRQIKFGKEFYKEEFGVDSKICYIPDSFGFSGALPQILRNCGLENFITSKISWNDTVEFPYDIFKWQGIDGSEITANFITAIKTEKVMHWGNVYGKEFVQKYTGTNYGAFAEPDYVLGTYENLKQKDKSDDFLFVYGYSDGGGGPTFKHLKCLEVMSKSIRNCPRTKFASLNEFVDKLNVNIQDQKLDVWKGELYLQFHRGTLTSMGEVKRNNRKAEFALMNLEFLCALNSVYNGIVYPKEEINGLWETVLTNQFHDILPGSCIGEQYDITRREYEAFFAKMHVMTETQERILCQDFVGEYVLFNPHSFTVSDYAEINGKYYYVENVPSKGLLSFSPNECLERKGKIRELENKYYYIRFDKNYQIVSIYDKINDREVLQEGEIGNRLRAYVDMPHVFDAWEIQDYYKEKYYDIDRLLDVEFISLGGKYGYKVRRQFRNSFIEQYICVYENKEGIYFETIADWKEEHILLKTEFPVAVKTDKATFDIQFGNIERSTLYNTSWEKAAFETCGHKYADYSQWDYGVTLMNDCKYGYDVHEGIMGLSLIKCATDPNKNADKGIHEFTYALYPHQGGLRGSNALRLSYLLNNPLRVIKTNGNGKKRSYSFAELDKNNVVLETVKRCEDGTGLILRLYEAFGIETKANLRVATMSKAYLCDMLERQKEELVVQNDIVSLRLKPYEILTIKCEE